MKILKVYNNFFKKYFPNPYTIAMLLSFVSFLVAYLFTKPNSSDQFYLIELMNYWYAGLFKSSLLAFTIHMMLVLVLGHIIALSKPVSALIEKVLIYCNSTSSAVLLVSLFTLIISFYNWGFGLVFGAIFARKIAQKFQREKQVLNYPLVAASAYLGMMIWHGGLSGSATLAVASSSHSYVNQIGVIPISATIFSSMNIFTTFLVFLILPIALYFIAKKSTSLKVPSLVNKKKAKESSDLSPIEKLEKKPYLSTFFGVFIFSYVLFLAYNQMANGARFLSVFNLQVNNLLLLSIAILVHGNSTSFLAALEEAIGDVSGILIQFPLYFGIMGVLQGSGLAIMIAEFFSQISTDVTLPIFTFLSAGLLNIFIPSGGGQWQVQAPIIIASAQNSGISLEKLIMAMCYGDQLTNMLQPFWALPILSITQLKAKDILPYCLLIFGLGFLIFSLSLLLF